MSNKVKVQEPAKAAKNAVKIAENAQPRFTPKNLVRMSLIVCKGIIKKDDFISFTAMHSFGYNGKNENGSKNYRTPLFMKVISSERLLEGITDIQEGDRLVVTGYLANNQWEKTQNLKEGQESYMVNDLVLTATEATKYAQGQHMPSVNEFEISGFVIKDSVKVGEFKSGDSYVRCSLVHPMGSFKTKNGEERQRPSVFVNAVSLPREDSKVDNELIADRNLLVISGSLRAYSVTDQQNGRIRNFTEFKINSLSQYDYSAKKETEVAVEEAPAVEEDAA